MINGQRIWFILGPLVHCPNCLLGTNLGNREITFTVFKFMVSMVFQRVILFSNCCPQKSLKTLLFASMVSVIWESIVINYFLLCCHTWWPVAANWCTMELEYTCISINYCAAVDFNQIRPAPWIWLIFYWIFGFGDYML